MPVSTLSNRCPTPATVGDQSPATKESLGTKKYGTVGELIAKNALNAV